MADDEERGLKKLRRVAGSRPTEYCKNCRCKRYSPCYCTVKK